MKTNRSITCSAARPSPGPGSTREAFWRRWVGEALRTQPTPFHLGSAGPYAEALASFNRALGATAPPGHTGISAPLGGTHSMSISGGRTLRLRHWLSFKTQPLRPLIRWWQERGGHVEVVSEFEFLAARAEGFPPGRILINGPAKHHWLPRQATPGLQVNFDSPREAAALLPLARRLAWSVGIRVLTGEERDPEQPEWPTQFGMTPEESLRWLVRLRRERVRCETVHFHLRSNVHSPTAYLRAIEEVAGVCRAARFMPRILDCGGGVPPRHTSSPAGRSFDADFAVRGLREAYEMAAQLLPGIEEVWLENGRCLSAGTGALVVTILDVKERNGRRHLICDGGRTLHALVSNWESHALLTLPARRGPACPTTVCGPTCMAFDQLVRRPLPRRLRAGDRLVWLEAGAYHLPWETRFSHGLAAVLWHENDRLHLVRPRERFEQWWGQWTTEGA